MTQPTALYLADILEDAGKPADIAEKCAAELRRLHAELERCKQVCAATSESWQTDAEKWKGQRDALLAVVNKLEYSSDGYIKRYPEESEVSAAIKQAEENT